MGIVGYINVALETFGAFFSLLVVAFLAMGKNGRGACQRSLVWLLVCSAAVLLCDAVSWLLEGRTDPLGRFGVEATCFGMFALSYVRLALFARYVRACVVARGGRSDGALMRVLWVLCAAAVALSVVSLFNGMFYTIDAEGRYARGDLLWASQWFGIVCMLAVGGMLVRHRRVFLPGELAMLALCILLPVAALAVQAANPGISYLNISTAIVAVVLYVGVQMERERALREQKLELERSRTRATVSRIQPQLLYSTLDLAHDLCASDPEGAKTVLIRFASFLRTNMDALARTDPVPSEQSTGASKREPRESENAASERRTSEREPRASEIAAPQAAGEASDQ